MQETTEDRVSRGRGWLARFLCEDGGQSLIEYALIACMIGLAAAISMTSVRTSIASVFNKIGNVLTNAL